MNLWQLCEGEKYIKTLTVEPWRVVEAQHVLSARDLVDTREEHDILEELLEDSKPEVNKDKHFLIFTPFRYPPLKYGSRFGQSFEPSLWYGGLTLETAFAEVAHYRLKFFQDSLAKLDYLEITMSAFKAYLSTSNGIDLTEIPFITHKDKISAKNSYEYSQILGSNMREASIEAFLYFSARGPSLARNVGVFSPAVFFKKNNQYIGAQQTWACIANKNIVEFNRSGVLGKERLVFEKS